ncbi:MULTISPECIES: PLP-dependent transferase [unclassified Mesorhizobium]|nr:MULTISPECIES: PLP-dependent transferase [unclassified Mesorhizobium]RUV40035.1 PLP-dependent transferase [Mesorhizobium sp. M1A.T.Ca.IN.004.03.1.1]TIP40672.1 MAG: PLP-dependent transferase [Mesorhizobium sp.]TIQ25686.1 MAG: PLP-dependent transferase [Mesorhizobium sp.]
MLKQTPDRPSDYLTEALRVYGLDIVESGPVRSLNQWQWQVNRLHAAILQRATELNNAVNIAEPVEDMDAFWTLATQTDAGITNLTYWDTFENGRRLQLERVLAEVYGSEQSILVNCGMSAIAVALGACKVRTGTRLLVGKSRYFETSGLIERHLLPLGVEIHAVDVAQPNVLRDALGGFRPEVVLLETIANMPSVDPVRDIAAWSASPSAPIFILDNSVQSALTQWFDLLDFPDRLLVVESGTKYITNDAMCGVIYGAGDLIASSRHYARDTGQSLQARALSYLDASLIRLLPPRMATHSRNVRTFATELSRSGITELKLTVLDSFADEGNAKVFAKGVGSLIYLVFGDFEGSDYKQLLTRWRQKARAHGDAVVPDVRAGFGWLKSSARVYETTRLNRADAPSYFRISLGLEDTEAVKASAKCLADAAKEILAGRQPALELAEFWRN